MALSFATVPPAFPHATIVCVGAGPSLHLDDLRYAANRGAILLAVNTTWAMCAAAGTPAHILYAPDAKWWHWYEGVPDDELPAYKYTIDPQASLYRPTVHLLNWRFPDGIDPSPSSVANGGHGGFQAINLAVHFHPRRIILLGYDLDAGPDGAHHCHAEHPDGTHPRYAQRRGVYESLIAPLADLGIMILNASRHTTIAAIPRRSLEECFA